MSASPRPRRVALVPIKGFDRGKSRLSAALPPVARARVARDLGTRALDALGGLHAGGHIDEIVVLTDSPAVSRWATERGWQPLRDGSARDLAQVVDQGLAHAEEHGFHEALVVMGDLWEVTVAALARLCAHPAPVAVPDHHGTGTNALLTALPPPGACSFGRPGSLALHLGTWGPGLAVLEVSELARDLDEPADLAVGGGVTLG